MPSFAMAAILTGAFRRRRHTGRDAGAGPAQSRQAATARASAHRPVSARDAKARQAGSGRRVRGRRLRPRARPRPGPARRAPPPECRRRSPRRAPAPRSDGAQTSSRQGRRATDARGADGDGARTGTNTEAHGLPSATQARPGTAVDGIGGRARPPSTPSSPRSRGCACTPSPRCRRRRPVGGCGARPGPSLPGAPHGPVPWSRRWATTARAAAERPPAAGAPSVRATKARLAARRPSANPVGVAGSRQVVEIGPRDDVGRRPGPVAPQGQAVGDGIAPLDRARRPRPARGLEDPGRGAVGDEERGPVGDVVDGVTDAALAVAFEEAGHDVEGVLGAWWRVRGRGGRGPCRAAPAVRHGGRRRC